MKKLNFNVNLKKYNSVRWYSIQNTEINIKDRSTLKMMEKIYKKLDEICMSFWIIPREYYSFINMAFPFITGVIVNNPYDSPDNFYGEECRELSPIIPTPTSEPIPNESSFSCDYVPMTPRSEIPVSNTSPTITYQSELQSESEYDVKVKETTTLFTDPTVSNYEKAEAILDVYLIRMQDTLEYYKEENITEFGIKDFVSYQIKEDDYNLGRGWMYLPGEMPQKPNDVAFQILNVAGEKILINYLNDPENIEILLHVETTVSLVITAAIYNLDDPFVLVDNPIEYQQHYEKLKNAAMPIIERRRQHS